MKCKGMPFRIVWMILILLNGVRLLAIADDVKITEWHLVDKKFVPINTVKDIELSENDTKIIAAVHGRDNKLLALDAISGAILQENILSGFSAECVVRLNEKHIFGCVGARFNGGRFPELRFCNVDQLTQIRTFSLPDFRLHRIASAAISNDRHFLWLSSEQTMSSLYGQINSVLFRCDLTKGDCTIIRGPSLERDGKGIPNLALPERSWHDWHICTASSGTVWVSDIHTNQLISFSGDKSEPVSSFTIPFMPKVMPRECDKILPIATTDKIALISLPDEKVLKILDIKGEPLAACVNSDGKTAFISVKDQNTVMQIDLETGKLLQPIDFCRPDGKPWRGSQDDYDTFDIVTLRWADNPPRLIALGYDGYILMIAKLEREEAKQKE